MRASDWIEGYARRRFVRRLRQVRQMRGLSQERLAELCGLHRTYVSSVERGERNITLDNMERLAMALQVDVTELLVEGDVTIGASRQPASAGSG